MAKTAVKVCWNQNLHFKWPAIHLTCELFCLLNKHFCFVPSVHIAVGYDLIVTCSKGMYSFVFFLLSNNHSMWFAEHCMLLLQLEWKFTSSVGQMPSSTQVFVIKQKNTLLHRDFYSFLEYWYFHWAGGGRPWLLYGKESNGNSFTSFFSCM